MISIDVDALAELVAAKVVRDLRAGTFGDLIDQAESPLGRRRHIALVRTRAPGCVQIGRRYLAPRAIVAEELAKRPAKTPVTDDATLARELGYTYS